MKYKIYKQLTDEEKDEWHFKYQDNEPPAPSLLWLVILYVLSIHYVGISLILAFLKPETTVDVLKLIKFTADGSLFIMLIFLINYIGSWLMYIYGRYKESKWLKKIGVKR